MVEKWRKILPILTVNKPQEKRLKTQDARPKKVLVNWLISEWLTCLKVLPGFEMLIHLRSLLVYFVSYQALLFHLLEKKYLVLPHDL